MSMSNKQKTALITGITGQDGSYLAELLLGKGYKVVGVKRRTSHINTERINGIYNHVNFKLEYGSLHDGSCFWRLLQRYHPHEIYNLGAQSHVRVSFDVPEETVDSIAMGTLRLLDAYRSMCPEAKFYQASSSEMYGDNPLPPFDENSRMSPASPYACAKLFAHSLVRNYREAYNLHASSGILFNHESPRRGETFVTRKITMAAARIKLGAQDKLLLGNLDARRDWGFAGDYVEAMWLMMQQDRSNDYVISTGLTHTVEEYVIEAFKCINIYEYTDYVEIDRSLYRPSEVPYLRGDYGKAKEYLGWEPKIPFKQLVQRMVNHDIQSRLQYGEGAIKA